MSDVWIMPDGHLLDCERDPDFACDCLDELICECGDELCCGECEDTP